jgi:hypothetical protein
MVERSFPDGLQIPVTAEGQAACLGVVDRNQEVAVTWVHSYVSVYDGPNPNAIRNAAERNAGCRWTRSPR